MADEPERQAPFQAPTHAAPPTVGRPPTMADIARAAGVSESTVSRALAGSSLVSAKTRDKVRRIAAAHHHRINERARSFRLQKSSTVALVTCGVRRGTLSLPASFLIDLVAELAERGGGEGYDLLISRDIHEDRALMSDLIGAQRAGGVIVLGQGGHHHLLNALADEGWPFVVWGAQRPDQRYATVGSNNVRGGAMAAGHLLALGRRRILFLGDPDHIEAGDRYRGYCRAHAEAGVAVDPTLVLRHHNAGLLNKARLQALLADGPAFDAVMATSDLLALGAIQTLDHAGVRVPHDVAVVGFDDIHSARHATPPLTTVRQDVKGGAAYLFDALIRRMAGDRPASVVLETRLIQRASCGG
ncbi:hypothetical protein CCR85_11275 [Rhodothalassium salexigens]|uniref:LacI family DNA-binding transcriptional regulator n=1 Tax=Rhodothalassium salexigens TaxID=1086 RepID=UPI001913D223|nr:substrate-binding domain-containing protein [Rhodothalassium salexigens]MBK5912070.1 hypothetical protein [Rhodothalassium salexigens]